MADAALDVLTAPRFVSTLMGHTITTLDAGSKFTVAVTSAGKMFAWGENREGQLALPKSSCVRKPKQIFAPAMDDDVVTDVACGWGHVIAKTDSGVLFSWGLNSHGQLGREAVKFDYQPKAITALADMPVSQVRCGAHYSVALAESGAVYSFGSGQAGHLGHGETNNAFTPTLIDDLDGKCVIDVATADGHTIAFTPTSLKQLIPVSGPLTGETRVHLKGVGLYDSPDVHIRMTVVSDDGTPMSADTIVKGSSVVETDGTVSVLATVTPSMLADVQGKAVLCRPSAIRQPVVLEATLTGTGSCSVSRYAVALFFTHTFIFTPFIFTPRRR